MKGITMSEHTMTTSSVESMKKSVHHCQHEVDSIMNLSVATKNLTTQTSDQLKSHLGESLQQMNHTMLSSCAPSKTILD